MTDFSLSNEEFVYWHVGPVVSQVLEALARHKLKGKAWSP